MSKDIIEFTRRKDLKLIRELGHGACGKTVLLHDEIIDSFFVCKKFSPISEDYREELFKGFIKEIKILHSVYHPGIVRIFNYYLYPEKSTGYILMEHIDGSDIYNYTKNNKSNFDSIFSQVIDGFSHLESNNILHRDIRPQNILVSKDGIVKIIDFGFGKNASKQSDFDKSITLNWWCEPPNDFDTQKYDFSTEVYFVGKLFEKMKEENSPQEFSHSTILQRMCEKEPALRKITFAEIKGIIGEKKFSSLEFSEKERKIYQIFSEFISNAISKIEKGATLYNDPALVESKLELAYKSMMLEETVSNNAQVLMCFINGAFYFSRRGLLSTVELKNFLEFYKSCDLERKNIVISNLSNRINSINRYTDGEQDADIPF